MHRALLLVILACAFASAQPKRYITLSNTPYPAFSLSGAMRHAIFEAEMNRKCDTVAAYITHKFYWIGPDKREYKISIDSIRGRGYARRALVTVSQKTDSSAYWTHAHPKYQPEIDSTTMSDTTFWTYTRTLDSTYRTSHWLDPMPDRTGGILWFMVAPDSTPSALWLRLLKVIGDPTKNNGYNQQALLVFEHGETLVDRVSHWIDSLDIKITKPRNR